MNRPVDAREANRLYWESDESVADIAARLDMSRRALYDAIEPLPTGASCEVCGGPMTFENRSARTADQPTCAVCGAIGAIGAIGVIGATGATGATGTPAGTDTRAAPRTAGTAGSAPPHRPSRLGVEDVEAAEQESLDRLLEERTVVVGGAALAGAALGALVTFMLVPRR